MQAQVDDNLKKQAELMSVIDKETAAYKHAFGYTEWRSACEVWGSLHFCICHDMTCHASEVCPTYLTGRMHPAKCPRSAVTHVCGAGADRRCSATWLPVRLCALT